MERKVVIDSDNKTKLDIPDKISWKSIFIARSGGFSSKRIAGILGWIVCLVIFIFAFILEKEIPTFADMVIVASSSLLGIDAFQGIFNKSSS